RGEGRHPAPPADVGLKRRELRREQEYFVPGLNEQLAEELLEHLGPRADNDVFRTGRDAKLVAERRRDLLPELGQAERGAVSCLTVRDRLSPRRHGRASA